MSDANMEAYSKEKERATFFNYCKLFITKKSPQFSSEIYRAEAMVRLLAGIFWVSLFNLGAFFGVLILDIITTLALIITLFFIIKYTMETKKLRIAAQEQNVLQLCPWIVLDYEEDFLKCRNIGSSPALNVEVSTLRAESNSTNELVFEVTFPTIYVLDVGDERVIEPEIDITEIL